MACRFLRAGLAALLAFWPALALAQNFPPPTLPLTGNETIPCIQGGGYKGCTPATISPSFTAQTANKVFAGPATGAAAAPTFRSLVGADLPNPSSTTLGGVRSITAVSSNFLTSISTSGIPAQARPACADLSNAAASCSTDATNASNISTGTLASARGGAGTINGALKGNGAGAVSQAACLDLSNGASGCSTSTGTSGATLPLLNGINTWSNTQTFTLAPVFTDQSGTRSALSLGSAATQNTGTSGATVPLLNANNTLSGNNTYSGTASFTGSTFSTTGSNTLGDAQADTTTVWGHVIGSGTVPTIGVGNCGTSPSVVAGSNDIRGKITTGTGGTTSCDITFATAYSSVPHCVVTSYDAAIFGAISGITTTDLAVAFGSAYDGKAFEYICFQ